MGTPTIIHKARNFMQSLKEFAQSSSMEINKTKATVILFFDTPLFV